MFVLHPPTMAGKYTLLYENNPTVHNSPHMHAHDMPVWL